MLKMQYKDKILIKLEEMNGYLNQLEEMIPSKTEYLENLTLRRACEKTIELAIECVIHIISIIVSNKRLGVPTSEDDLVKILTQKKIISKNLALKVTQMKGFRNIIVHKYGDVDDKKVYKYLTEELNDFALFEKEVKKFLQK